jgi:hypothetical protein
VAVVVEHPLSKPEALSSNPSTANKTKQHQNHFWGELKFIYYQDKVGNERF